MNFFFKTILLSLFCTITSVYAQNYVSVKKNQFFYRHYPYYFIGTNYWYAPYLGLEKNQKRGIYRLQKELDFLKSQGISNLRVLVAVEGNGKINGVNRVEPSYQDKPGNFNDAHLKGLDIFLNEIAKRNMKAVLFLSNNWEWSGGWLQYLNWNEKIDSETLKRTLNWDELRDYTSQFYSCENCIHQYQEQIKKIISRKNSVSGEKYSKDKSIMAWEIANEPRPMRPSAIPAFKKFIKETASLIKSLDTKHLLTIGSEGEMGSETMDVFKEIHQDPNIDYLTIHIWPKNWGWFTKETMEQDFEKTKNNTLDYIKKHLNIADELKKPIVLEEFGFPRDHHSFDINSTTHLRNQYYDVIFNLWQQSKDKNGSLAGCTFWAFNGFARPISGQIYWKKGDDYMGDPPMEEQGLNGVFDSDTKTWETIRKYTEKEKTMIHK